VSPLARLIAAGLVSAAVLPAPAPDPAHGLARVRVVVTTRAGVAAVMESGATLASYASALIAGPPGAKTTHGGFSMQVGSNVPGQSAEGQFDMVLASVPASGAITWSLATDVPAETTLEVYSTNQLERPVLIDRFTATGTGATFASDAARINAHGAIAFSLVRPRRVLAHFYPWYTTDTWGSPEFADRPQPLYSTDSPSDLRAEASMARGAGIDTFVVSWTGHETDGGLHDRRLQLVLDAAQATGITAAALTETFYANRDNVSGEPVDPQVMLNWLTDIVDQFGSHPAYLRIDNRPAVFVYSASLFDMPTWADILGRLRATGRDLLLVGDFFHSRLIEVLDGEYQYSNVTLTPDGVRQNDLIESLRARTFNLLTVGGRRRVWIASVAPGYDDTRIVERPTHLTVDRQNGAVYDAQWSAAVDTGADWVIVTSWNEWYENTEIEPGNRYGTYYLDRTREWTALFKGSGPGGRTVNRLGR
jgi:hypothetical protein